MNLKYTLDMTRQSCKWLEASQRSEDHGPLILSFAGAEKQQTSGEAPKAGGFFTVAMAQSMIMAQEFPSKSLLEFAKFADENTKSLSRKVPPHKEQAPVVTTNMPLLDLEKCTFLDLVNGSICGKDGSIKQQYRTARSPSILKPDTQETPHSPHPPRVVSPVMWNLKQNEL